MAERIEDILSELDAWYNELPGGTERPSLLSKLAALELCGWVEERFDSMATNMANAAGVADGKAVVSRIDGTYGFRYADHVRGLFLAIGGEMIVQRAEATLEKNQPGELSRLQSALGALWKHRCELAHVSSVKVTGKQLVVNAPSWSVNQQRVLSKLIDKYEAEIHAAIVNA